MVMSGHASSVPVSYWPRRGQRSGGGEGVGGEAAVDGERSVGTPVTSSWRAEETAICGIAARTSTSRGVQETNGQETFARGRKKIRHGTEMRVDIERYGSALIARCF